MEAAVSFTSALADALLWAAGAARMCALLLQPRQLLSRMLDRDSHALHAAGSAHAVQLGVVVVLSGGGSVEFHSTYVAATITVINEPLYPA